MNKIISFATFYLYSQICSAMDCNGLVLYYMERELCVPKYLRLNAHRSIVDGYLQFNVRKEYREDHGILSVLIGESFENENLKDFFPDQKSGMLTLTEECGLKIERYSGENFQVLKAAVAKQRVIILGGTKNSSVESTFNTIKDYYCKN